MKFPAFYATEAAAVLAAAGGLALGAGWSADWLSASLWHPLVVPLPAGVALRLARGRHPVDMLVRWHGVAVRRLDG